MFELVISNPGELMQSLEVFPTIKDLKESLPGHFSRGPVLRFAYDDRQETAWRAVGCPNDTNAYYLLRKKS